MLDSGDEGSQPQQKILHYVRVRFQTDSHIIVSKIKCLKKAELLSELFVYLLRITFKLGWGKSEFDKTINELFRSV